MREVNSGVVTCGEPPANAVIVVTGLGRGGTTSLAELLSTLEHLHWTGLANLEDYEFAKYIENDELTSARWIVAGRGTRWVVKRPHVWRYAPRLQQVLQERLVWVFVFRDPIAIAVYQARVSGELVEDAVRRVQKELDELTTFATIVEEPKAMVSYEKSLTQRERIRWHLGQWLHGDRFTQEEWIS